MCFIYYINYKWKNFFLRRVIWVVRNAPIIFKKIMENSDMIILLFDISFSYLSMH